MGRSGVAFVAALVLLLQSLLPAGAHAAGPLLDIFGNPLCISGADGHSPVPPNDHSQLPDCCAANCSGFAHAAVEPDLADTEIAHPAVPHGFTIIAHADVHIAPDEYSPGKPRGPPLVL